MSLFHVLPWMFLLAAPSEDAGWQEAARTDGVTVFRREKPGGVHELKAVGVIDAPPQSVWQAVRDYANYDRTMPYTEDSKVLASEEDGKVIYFYSAVDAPFVAKRDYLIRILDESDWKDGAGFLLARWSLAPPGRFDVPERSGVVRLKLNDGYWRLEPRDGGTKTFATYYVFTDPGGSIPKWLVNKANNSAVPDVFKAIRKQTSKRSSRGGG